MAESAEDQCRGECLPPPPTFSLPPPPLPPSMAEDCISQEAHKISHPVSLAIGHNKVDPFDQFCDKPSLQVAGMSPEEDSEGTNFFLYLVIVVVSALVLVGVILTTTAVIWR